MGTRNTSTYCWQLIEYETKTSLGYAGLAGTVFQPRILLKDMSGAIWFAGDFLDGVLIRRKPPNKEHFETVQVYTNNHSLQDSNFDATRWYEIVQDSSGTFFACGQYATGSVPFGPTHWTVWKSSTGLSGTWQIIDDVPNSGSAKFIAIDSQDRIYVAGDEEAVLGSTERHLLRRSTDHGVTWQVVDSAQVTRLETGPVMIDSNDGVYVVVRSGSYGAGLRLRKSPDGSSGTFADIGAADVSPGTTTTCDSKGYVDSSNRLYYTSRTSDKLLAHVHMFNSSSQTFAIAAFVTQSIFSSFGTVPQGGVVGQDGEGDYFWTHSGHFNANDRSSTNIDRSPSGDSGSFSFLTRIQSPSDSSNDAVMYDTCLDNDGGILFAGFYNNDQGVVIKGKRYAHSQSFSPITLATSIVYAYAEHTGALPPSGTLDDERAELFNVSEFPHAGGLFQMRNLVLGTTTSGKIGKSEDSIIQVNHIGSVVRVMWPKQNDTTLQVKGYGDFSSGQRAGKLDTTIQPGDSYDATDYDHLALYCFLRKEVSGTLDDVVITVERKPLKSIGYATEQAIEYTISGSYTEARLRDVVYSKQIDYADHSIREIGFPIDVPLVNVKEIRITARHKNGQTTEENKNFIVWGRFIKSDKNTNET